MENKKQFIKGFAVGILVTVLLAGGIFAGSNALTKASDEKKAESASRISKITICRASLESKKNQLQS